MANDVSAYPWKLDTVASNIVLGQRWIAKVRWVGATVAGHVATISDGTGRVIWTSFASGANYVETDSYPTPKALYCVGTATTGLTITTLSSGTLFIYEH